MKLHRSLAALCAAALACSAHANDTKVLTLFNQKCADCHSNGDEEPELHGGVNLTQLRNSEDNVKNIMERLTRPDEAKGRMPKSKGKEGDASYLPPLTADEIALVKAWAESPQGGSSPVAKEEKKTDPTGERQKAETTAKDTPAAAVRPFVSIRDEVTLIAEDIEKQPASSQPFLRYLTLANLGNLRNSKNELVEDEGQMNLYRAAIGKMLNSLSHEAQIHVPEPIDLAKVIYRLDLRSYGWTREEWESNIAAVYPFALRGFDARRERQIATATQSRVAWVRADWFVFSASQPPLYNQMLRLPASDGALETELGIDVMDNLKTGRAIRAGFRESGVSQGNRMIERHEIGTYPGAYWKSYDFSPLVREIGHDLFRSPLGPPGAGLTKNTDREFRHDGGEMVWNLKNGLQGYYLATSAGVKLDRAPTEIVQDKKRRDGAIINGISCMACHDAGIKYTLDKPLEDFRDEVGVVALKAGLDRDEQHAVEDLYVPQEKLHAVVKADEERFRKALALAMPGFDQPLDPVSRLYNRFKADLKLETLAAEFGEKDPGFLKRLRETRDANLESIAVQLEVGMGFPRANFTDQFKAIVQALDYEQLDFTALKSTEFASEVGKTGGHEGQVRLADGGRLSISTDKGHYVKDDLMTVKLKCTEGVFVRLYHLSAEKKVTQIFPNAGQPDNFIKGGKEVNLPGSENKFRFRMGEPFGTEIILAVASPVQFTDSENLRFGPGEVFKSFNESDLRNAERRGLKGLTVGISDASGKTVGQRSAQTFTARAVFTVGPQ